MAASGRHFLCAPLCASFRALAMARLLVRIRGRPLSVTLLAPLSSLVGPRPGNLPVEQEFSAHYVTGVTPSLRPRRLPLLQVVELNDFYRPLPNLF
jgi:hypothetical protein